MQQANAFTNAQVVVCGGGPAGMVLGLLLARAGVRVHVIEKHNDFLRDFRGDTVHPSTLQVMQELGLLDEFLKRPHDEARQLQAVVGGRTFTIADFSRLSHPFIALMPQWEFLDFIRDEAAKYPSFSLTMNAQADDLVRDADGRIAGVRGHRRTPQGEPTGEVFEFSADLVVACDGRSSDIRRASGLTVWNIGSPIDVLWMRIPRRPADPSITGGRIERGRFLVTINRGDYWQCAYVIPKGGNEQLRARGIESFRHDLVQVAPLFADRVDAALPDWEPVKLLSVTVDRLDNWSTPGLLAIGDAAHAMSPIGGVGVNLAVQDAVATANLLAAPMSTPGITHAQIDAMLPKLQERRTFPVRATQAMQVAIQNRLLKPVLASDKSTGPLPVPWILKLMDVFPVLRSVPAYLVGTGARPEHVQSPAAKSD